MYDPIGCLKFVYLCLLFLQREAMCFWDANWSGLVQMFWDDSGLHKKRKEGKRVLFLNSFTLLYVCQSSVSTIIVQMR